MSQWTTSKCKGCKIVIFGGDYCEKCDSYFENWVMKGNMNMFEIGDRVWSFEFGWGEVIDPVGERQIPHTLAVLYNDIGITEHYLPNGKHKEIGDQVLFFQEIIIPKEAFFRPWVPTHDEVILVRNAIDLRWEVRKFDGMFKGLFEDIEGQHWKIAKSLKQYNEEVNGNII